jgi:hypothetical protein
MRGRLLEPDRSEVKPFGRIEWLAGLRTQSGRSASRARAPRDSARLRRLSSDQGSSKHQHSMICPSQKLKNELPALTAHQAIEAEYRSTLRVLHEGRKMSGYENALTPSADVTMRPGFIAIQVRCSSQVRMPLRTGWKQVPSVSADRAAGRRPARREIAVAAERS